MRISSRPCRQKWLTDQRPDTFTQAGRTRTKTLQPRGGPYIFFDEGFGSLDTENGAGTLDQVIQVLAALTEGSRAVGLISHVGLVQEAIPQGFYVRSTPSGSRVEERRGTG